MEETISLDEILQLLKKKWVLIVSMLVFGTVISSIMTFFILTPKYAATTQLVVQTKGSDSNINTDNINSNLLLINTYKDLVKSDAVTEKAKDKLVKDGMTNMTEDYLKSVISVEQSQNSQLFSIKAVTPNAIESATIANTISKFFQEEAVKMTDTDKISIASKATPNEKPVSPNKKVNIAIGAMLGLIAGLIVALVTELFNKSVKSEEFITEKLGLSLLGTIPIVDEREMREVMKIQQNPLIDEDFFYDVTLDNDLDNMNLSIDNLSDKADGLDMDLMVNEKRKRHRVNRN
ncbi:YveK family protein [Vagococcus bubulae]|uniref:Capsular polysaccharide biosynthesis protein CpsC n=1 Tax=Vagococcus bubulae TaxID=1977868 RepID=A0A429ZMA3_9ENTE|nr:Wzz/FepE/Etk N-terminal domain-containing protein [Vagococcus bubulae]RST94789.1 hypothetical protein CBF36_04475 [Vagococcus bubulae]